MDKYYALLKMMGFMSRHAQVTDVDMNYCGDRVRIVGENDGEVITIEVTITKKAVEE